MSWMEPKKMRIWHLWVDKTQYRFLVTSGVYFLEKYDELSELVTFAQKFRYFTDQSGRKGGQHENEF